MSSNMAGDGSYGFFYSPIRRVGSVHSFNSNDLTVGGHYYGKGILFGGNQLILWARELMATVIKTPDRDIRISHALSSKTAEIRSIKDWLNYEGMFSSFIRMPAKESRCFIGILRIYLNEHFTYVEFKDKTNNYGSNLLLYAHLADERLIRFIEDELQFRFQTYQGRRCLDLSYIEMVSIVLKIKEKYQVTDAEIAKMQLDVLKHAKIETLNCAHLFLAYFNAILFGSELSRNSLSFITGILVLEMIMRGEVTYVDAFLTEDSYVKTHGRAIYPMASPGAGTGNIRDYKQLIAETKESDNSKQLSSYEKMQLRCEYPIWAQVQLKEAILFRHYAKGIFTQKFSLACLDSEQNLSEEDKKNAKGTAIPILIKRNEQLSIYGYVNGQWQETRLDLHELEEEERKVLSQLDFRLKFATINFFSYKLRNILRRNHAYVDTTPRWLNANLDHLDVRGHALEFSRQFREKLLSLLNQYLEGLPKFVYSQDEMDALSTWRSCRSIWNNPVDDKDTETVSNRTGVYLTSATPLRLEKDIEVAEDDLEIDIKKELEDLDGDTFVGVRPRFSSR